VKEETPRFRVTLEPRSEAFAASPTDFQRNWVLRRALREFADDLEHLDRQARCFVPGIERPDIGRQWEDSAAALDPDELIIQGQQVMQAWELPLMARLAQVVTRGHGDVLEVGFGMGISATLIQDAGARSHTIIECNEGVIRQFERWRERFPDRDIRLVTGQWQDVVDQLDSYDGILFDTYPLSQEEYVRNEVGGTAYTHAAEFFPVAARLLRPGGGFSYFSCEIDTLSRGHQREVLRHFDSFSVDVVRGLRPPENCQYWWSDSMVVVRAARCAKEE